MRNEFCVVLCLMVLYFGLTTPLEVGAGGEDVKSSDESRREIESIYEHFADISTTMLLSVRNVIAKNQELINRDPDTGNYHFKGFVPAIVGSHVANDFNLRTGYKLKQTALRVRNPKNKPDEWEEKALRVLEKDQTKNGFGEMTKVGNKNVYRYMKPLYMKKECLLCHSVPEAMPPEVRAYINKYYATDEALGYKEGDLRGGISIAIPVKEWSIP